MLNRLAVIFDFDDTLTNDSTSTLLLRNGFSQEDVDKFWKKEVEDFAVQGWEPTLAWLHLLLKLIQNRTIAQNTSKLLREFGQTLESYCGLEGLLNDLEQEVGLQSARLKELSNGSNSICIDFYIISAGIQEVIDGFPLSQRFKGRWGSQLMSDAPDGQVKYVSRAITFTEKTRYLFAIQKGINLVNFSRNPEIVNDIVDETDQIPFANIVYVADGGSDVPCFSIVRQRGGRTVVLLQRTARGDWLRDKTLQTDSWNDDWSRKVEPRKSAGPYMPDYRPVADLGRELRRWTRHLCQGFISKTK